MQNYHQKNQLQKPQPTPPDLPTTAKKLDLLDRIKTILNPIITRVKHHTYLDNNLRHNTINTYDQIDQTAGVQVRTILAEARNQEKV